MQRIDKFVSSQTSLSRNDVKKLLKKGFIKVNGNTISKSNGLVDENNDIITVNGEEINYKKYVYNHHLNNKI